MNLLHLDADEWNNKLQVFDPSSLLSKRKNKCKVIVEKVKD